MCLGDVILHGEPAAARRHLTEGITLYDPSITVLRRFL